MASTGKAAAKRGGPGKGPAKPSKWAKPAAGKSDQGKPGQGKSGQGKSGQGKSGQGKSGQGKSGQAKSGQAKSGQRRSPGKPKSDQAKSGKSGQAKWAKSGQAKPGPVTAAPARPAEEGAAAKPATPKPAPAFPAPNEVRIGRAEFTAGAAGKAQIPPAEAPEIAFAGRSNVGKSSLLNMMLALGGLARTSRTPGCTRQINFFDVGVAGGPDLMFVDLPGYGYAKVSKSESLAWKNLLEGYLREREALRAVVILVDVRRGLEQEERDLIEFLGLRPDLRVFIAATKLDKLPRSQHKPTLAALARRGGVRVFGTSAETRHGREELWAELLRVAKEAEPLALDGAAGEGEGPVGDDE